MLKSEEIRCPKCKNDRPDMLERGLRKTTPWVYCMVCAHNWDLHEGP